MSTAAPQAAQQLLRRYNLTPALRASPPEKGPNPAATHRLTWIFFGCSSATSAHQANARLQTKGGHRISLPPQKVLARGTFNWSGNNEACTCAFARARAALPKAGKPPGAPAGLVFCWPTPHRRFRTTVITHRSGLRALHGFCCASFKCQVTITQAHFASFCDSVATDSSGLEGRNQNHKCPPR